MATKKTSQRKIVGADASSLILLTKSGLIAYVVAQFHLIIPDEVYEETVVRGKTKGQMDAFQLERLFQEKKIRKQAPAQGNQRLIQSLFGLKGGERDAIALAQELGIPEILMDDKRGINACKVLGLSFITALDFLVTLQKQGIISKAEAYKSLSQLEQYGWYSKTLLDRARSDIHAA